MQCPKCGNEQQQSTTCTKCGIIFSKYNQSVFNKKINPAKPGVEKNPILAAFLTLLLPGGGEFYLGFWLAGLIDLIGITFAAIVGVSLYLSSQEHGPALMLAGAVVQLGVGIYWLYSVFSTYKLAIETQYKKCVYCRENIMKDASVCKHCGK